MSCADSVLYKSSFLLHSSSPFVNLSFCEDTTFCDVDGTAAFAPVNVSGDTGVCPFAGWAA